MIERTVIERTIDHMIGFICIVAILAGILCTLIYFPSVTPSDEELKARYDKHPDMQIEIWDNGHRNTARIYITDSIYSRYDNCIVFRERPYVGRQVDCGDNIVITKREF